VINELERIWQEAVSQEFQVLSPDLLGGIEENYEKPQSG
jgi:hypothetical protein